MPVVLRQYTDASLKNIAHEPRETVRAREREKAMVEEGGRDEGAAVACGSQTR
jgi:hypothetical protein